MIFDITVNYSEFTEPLESYHLLPTVDLMHNGIHCIHYTQDTCDVMLGNYLIDALSILGSSGTEMTEYILHIVRS